MQLNLNEIKSVEKQYWLQHVITPRPIGLVSSVDKEGNVNLSPFSFFNIFSCKPPIVIFSPARRLRDNSVKHTLQNVMEVPEVVIHMVSHDMTGQTSLASSDYDKGVDEFIKAGFTKEKATLVKPPMVKESPFKLECSVLEIKSLGENAGAGQLVICEVLCLHVDDNFLTENKKFDASKLDLVARLGGNLYSRINTDNLFEVEKPGVRCGIGMDQLPAYILKSNILTGNQLARLAALHELPQIDEEFKDAKWNVFYTIILTNITDCEKFISMQVN